MLGCWNLELLSGASILEFDASLKFEVWSLKFSARRFCLVLGCWNLELLSGAWSFSCHSAVIPPTVQSVTVGFEPARSRC